MATVSTLQFKCSNCGELHPVEVYSSINLSQDSDIKEKLSSGSLFVWECPHCGRANLALYPLLYHDPENKIMIWLLPVGSVSEDKIAALSSQLSSLEGYILRRVEDIGSFIEKINIFDAGLDDRVLEMCKWVTKRELSEKQGKEKAEYILDAPFKFYKMAGPDNEIFMTYPDHGNMEGVNIGFNVYEDCRGIIQRNPEITSVNGFAKVNQDWVSSFLK